MSALATFGGGSDSELALLRKIVERTSQGKIKWAQLASAISAKTPNGLQFDFIVSPPMSFLGTQPRWVTFTVREGATQILTVQNTTAFIPILSPLVGEADKLFGMIYKKAEDNLDRAIKKLDQI